MTKLSRLIMVGAASILISIGLLTISLPQAFAAGYLKLGDIKGESTDSEHKDWIIIESMSSPIFRSTQDSEPTAAGMASGKRQHKPLVITKELDKASPKLQEAATKGKVFPKVIIHVQANEGSSAYGGARATYLKYELENVMITSYQVSGDSAAGEVPMEEFALNYEEIKVVGGKPEDEKEDSPRNQRR